MVSKYPPPLLDFGQDGLVEPVAHALPLGGVLQECTDAAEQPVRVRDALQAAGVVVVVVPDDAEVWTGLLGCVRQESGAAEEVHDRGDAGEAAQGIRKTASEVFLLAEKRKWGCSVNHALGVLSFTWSSDTVKIVRMFMMTSTMSFFLE